ncbi:MAG: hypothetical protein HZB33_01480 [Nitrospirae bacterium]|nr:hypothetical protein [Nitrospirota bacterium]
MKRNDYFILLGIAAATGAGVGLLSSRARKANAGLLGAAAGIIAGSCAAGVYQYVTQAEKVPYYSKLSPLYDETDAV